MTEETGVAKGDNTMARKYRRIGLALGIVYLLLQQIFPLLPHFVWASPAVLRNMLVSVISYGTAIAGLACFGYLEASLFVSRTRDWRAIDRVVGILLIVYVVKHVFMMLLFQSPEPMFTESTQHVVFALAVLSVVLFLLSAVLFFVRPSWASLPLILFAVLLTYFRFAPIEPDNPEFQAQLWQPNIEASLSTSGTMSDGGISSDTVVVRRPVGRIVHQTTRLYPLFVVAYAILRSVMAFRERTKNKLVAADSGSA